MNKNIVIVESPAKAKTIEGYLGKDFLVTSSMGHVRDLIKGNHAIDVKNNYAPTYAISKDKTDVVKLLKKMVKTANMIYLASDDDREGEAISWHLKEALGLSENQTKRIVFTEVTKKAVQKALESPRKIDEDLVNAQQARRVLDRLVGFELSPILWKKIKAGLSAGRVQSVAVRLVVEREREIEAFEPTSYYKVSAIFGSSPSDRFTAIFPQKILEESEVLVLLEQCKKSVFTVTDIEEKPVKKSPAPPFTTSTLQQEASRRLGFSVLQTMAVAQKLYESGKISYMRTDSLHLSEEALGMATKQIEHQYGSQYVHRRQYKTKKIGAQEAHEAIRPTNFDVQNVDIDYNASRLYQLIWKRAIASQMADALLKRTYVTIDMSKGNHTLSARGEIIAFEGFMKVYTINNEENGKKDAAVLLPPIVKGQQLVLSEVVGMETFTRHAPRFTEASLVKKLEEMGIGRPSTYAPTISTIQKRDYVVKENREGIQRKFHVHTLAKGKITSSQEKEMTGAEKNKLFPTHTAMIVNDFLVDHFPNVTDYSFTSDVEKNLDDIAQGKQKWQQVIDTFYKPFHKTVEITEKIERSAVSNKIRELGLDPKTQLKVYAKLGRYGGYVQLGENPEEGKEDKPRYASIPKEKFLENITLEEALPLFKMPRELGDFEALPIEVNIGRYGPYVLHNKKYTSIPKEEDPYTFTKAQAIALIEAKRMEEANRIIKTFDEDTTVQILNGRYGPYIKVGKKNVRIPKGEDPSDLTLEQCLSLAKKAPEKKKYFGAKKKK